MRLPRLRFTVQHMMIAVAAVAIVLTYLGSYYRLSRRGMSEASEYGSDGFLYVPFREAIAPRGLSRHYALAAFYAPLNWLDRRFFGASGPVDCLMGLEGVQNGPDRRKSRPRGPGEPTENMP